jgi:hypothetical protein
MNLWDTMESVLSKAPNSDKMMSYQDANVVHDMVFENYAKSQMNIHDLQKISETLSNMDMLRSGNIKALLPEAGQLVLRLPKINVSKSNITYPSKKTASVTFKDM